MSAGGIGKTIASVRAHDPYKIGVDRIGGAYSRLEILTTDIGIRYFQIITEVTDFHVPVFFIYNYNSVWGGNPQHLFQAVSYIKSLGINLN